MGTLRATQAPVVLLILAACAALGIVRWFSTYTPAVDLNIGSPAPLFSLSNVEGEIVSLKQLRGKTVFICFLTTWCPQCAKEIAELQAFSTQLEYSSVLSITVGESEEIVARYTKSHGITFPVLLDKSSKVAEQYQLRAVPDMWVLNPDGTIWGHFSGPVNLELLQNIITTMGAEASGA